MSGGLEPVGVEMVARGSDAFFRAMEKGDRAVGAFGKGVDSVAKHTSKAFDQMATGATRRIGEHVADSFINAGMEVGRFIGGSLGAAGKFETTMNRFSSVAGSSLGESGKALSDFDALFMKMGADTQFSAQQAGDAAIELAKGGRNAGQVFSELGDSLSLASAGEVDLATAAELSAKQLAIWEDQGVKSGDVADLLAQAANASTVGVADLGVGLANVGGVAKVAGLSFEETVQTLAKIAPGFSSASDAGTSFKAFLNNLQPTTKPATEAMEELGLWTKEAGSKFYDATGNFIGMESASQLLYDSTHNLSEAEKSLALETIFGSDAQRAAALIAEDGAAGYLAMGEAMGKAGSATDQAKEKNKGYAFQLETMRGSLETFQIKLGQLLIGPATEFIQFLTDAVNGLTTLIDFVNGSSDAVDENAESHSTLAKIMNVLPFGAVTANIFEMRHQQRLAADEAERHGKIITEHTAKAFGLFTDLLDRGLVKVREARIATGELGAQGLLTADELKVLTDELLKIEEEGTKAVQSAVQTQAGYLIESRDRRSEHLAKLKELNQQYRTTEDADEKAGIAKQIEAQITGHNQSQLQADIAYARQGAAQRAHLGELLINWTNTQIAMGAITAEQGDAINETIATKFGVAADNTALLFGKMTGSILETAKTGGDIDALGATLQNLQTDAANTQVKINALEEQAFARLDQELKDGKITLAEYRQKILEVPGEVRTKVEMTGAAEAKTNAIAIGYSMSQGLATGVANGRGLVAGAVTEAIGAAYAAGRSYAGIQSPSKLFASGVGIEVSRGIGWGIDMGMPEAVDSLVDGLAWMTDTGLRGIDRMGTLFAQATAHAAPSGWSWDSAAVFGGEGGVIGNGGGGGGWGGMSTVTPPATPSQIMQSTQNSYDHSRHVNYSATYHNTPPAPDRDSAHAAALANIP